MVRFDLHRPFTEYVANRYKGRHAHVICQECGLQASYHGVIQPHDDKHTKVGEELLVNECITHVDLRCEE